MKKGRKERGVLPRLTAVLLVSLLLLITLITPAMANDPSSSRIAGGLAHSLIVKNDRTLWTCGLNDCGQLGTGDTVNRLTPVQIMTDVVSVCGARAHSLALKRDGSLWAFGANYAGQLGTGDTSNRLTPTKIMDGVIAIGIGRDHSLALKADGTLWGFGANYSGQLGTGDTLNRTTPVRIMDDVVAMTGGVEHSMAVKRDGTLWGFGANYYGQLGTGDTQQRLTPVQVMTGVSSVTSRFMSTLAVKTDGSLWAFGLNDGGQLGTGGTDTRLTPVPVLNDVAAVSMGWYHSLALKRDGTLWGFGTNGRGELGTGDTANRFTPVPIMTSVVSMGTTAAGSSLALKADGTVWAFGANDCGQLGTGDMVDRHSPVMIMAMDITPPTTTLSTNPASPDGANGWFVSPATVTLTSSEPGTTLYQWDADFGAWTTYGGAFSAPEGRHTLYYCSVDQAGNREPVETRDVKVDLTAPNLTVPQNMTLEASGPDGARADFTATATDNLSASTVTYSKNPGTVFPIGETTVTATATDEAGNASSKSFTVKVQDTTAPTAPSSLKATPKSALLLFTQSINLTWSGASDIVGVASYVVQRSTDGKTWSNLATVGGSTTSYADTNLKPLTRYYYRILAKDASGNTSNNGSPTASAMALLVLR